MASHLAADGETLPVNAYWLRREKEGDVNITEPPKSPLKPIRRHDVHR
jgi:hypothetical protein